MEAARSAVLERYGVGPDDRVGRGGEAEVFALDAHRVLRLHRQESEDHARAVAELCGQLDRGAVPYALPEVLEVHGNGETSWTIERRFPGRPFDLLLPELRGEARARALTAYVDGAAAFAGLGMPRGWTGGCGELFTAERLRSVRWGDLLAERLRLQLAQARPSLAGTVPALDAVGRRIVAEARTEEATSPRLVHGDWFPGNVMLDDDLRVSAALDLGWLTVVGDPGHDVRSAVVFMEPRPWGQPGDPAVLLAAAQRHLGPDAHRLVDRTRRYEQARFAFAPDDDLHRWCVAGLRAVAEDLSSEHHHHGDP
jgi:fructosamine-3-kinase